MQFALQQYGVAPTDLANTQYNAARAAAQYNCAVPHGSQVAQHAPNNANSGAAGTGGHAGAGRERRRGHRRQQWFDGVGTGKRRRHH